MARSKFRSSALLLVALLVASGCGSTAQGAAQRDGAFDPTEGELATAGDGSTGDGVASPKGGDDVRNGAIR